MSFNNVDQLNLGNLLQIVFSNGVRNQISQDYRDWEYINRYRIGNTAARELRFMFQTSYGPSAIQYRDPGTSGRSFPAAQQASVSENSAKFKEINATIELEYNLWDRARKSPEKYAEPLALEIQAKTTASKRRIAADLYGDGTGVVGELAAASATANGDGTVTFQLATTNAARGTVGFFEFGDQLLLRAEDGTTSALDTDLATEPASWRVVSKDRDNDKVTLRGLDSSGADVSVASFTTQPDAGEVFYRAGQPTLPDLTAAIADYGTVTEVMAGLASLTAADGRVIHGITMSGSSGGSRTTAAGQPLDVSYIQKALDNVKINVGQDAYSWKMMCMAPEAHASLIESRETDRRFQTVEDNKRGIKYFAYMHGNDTVETYTSEYVPKKKIYMLPEAKSSDKVLEYWGSDFETVKAQGTGDFHLKPGSGGGHVNTIVSYLSSIGVIVCKHPASIAVVEDFTV
jgi:hypothetical protein